METLHHEIWHAVECHHLSPEAVEIVSTAVEGGRHRPGYYLASAVERRARLYASWACAVDEGHQLVLSKRTGEPVSELDRVFLHVYSGELARAVTAPTTSPRPGVLARVWRWLV